jgi:hypothetical protein
MKRPRHPSPPTRHAASSKNRRKALRFAKNLRDEIEYIERLVVNIHYMRKRIEKLINRLTAERR